MQKTSNLDKAAWAICPYITHIDRVRYDHPKAALKDCKCKKCPSWEMLDGEKVQRACRGMAEEAIEPVLRALSLSSAQETS